MFLVSCCRFLLMSIMKKYLLFYYSNNLLFLDWSGGYMFFRGKSEEKKQRALDDAHGSQSGYNDKIDKS